MAGQTVQLYVNSSGTWLLLDLLAEDPIKLTLQNSSIEDPLKVASAFTRSFRVPNTRKNADFFKTAFNVNTEDFNPAIKVAAYINDTGGTLVSGNLRLNDVIRGDEKQAIYYEIGFFGETSDFGTTIGGKYLSELKLLPFNHVRNYQAIQNSWSVGIFGGAVRYPLIEWGYEYDGSSPPNATTPTLTNGFSKSFTSSANALNQGQFKPAIRLKNIWDSIINPTNPTPGPFGTQVGFSGYTYSSSSWMNSSIFNNLYVVLDNTARAQLTALQIFRAQVVNPPGSNFPVNASTSMVATQEISDPGNNYNVTLSTYTAPATGNYVFQIETFGQVFTGNNITGQMRCKFKVKITPPTGVPYFVYAPLGTGVTFVPVTSGTNLISGNINVAGMAQGSIVEAQLEMLAGGGSYSGTNYRVTQGAFTCTLAPQFINMQQLMPNNIKVSDFMKSIIERFKLVFIPNPNNPKEFTIIPWVDWVRSGTSRDWTDYLDTSKEFKISPLWEGQTRNNIYVDSEDGDYVNFNYKLATKEVYGQLFQDSGNELLKDTTTRESIFAPTPIDSLFVANGASAWRKIIIPKLAKDSPSRLDPILPKPRLLFWNGLQSNSVAGSWFMKNDTTAAVGQSNYPLMSEYQQWPAIPSTLNLLWNWKPPVYDAAQGPVSNPTGLSNLTVYNQYWAPWYDTVYNNYSKGVEAYFTLDYAELKDFKFNDYIWVKDAWYLVDKISDYIVGQSTTVKVKMYKVSNSLGLTVPNSLTTLPQVSLCPGTTACAAKCCSGAALATGVYFTQTPAAMVVNTSQLFSDPYGNIPAPAGFYKYSATVIWQIGTNGVFLGSSNPTCNCITNPSTPVALRSAYAPTSIESVACAAPLVPPVEVNIYGRQSNTFDENVDYYLEAACETPAPTGFYRYLDVPTDFIIKIEDGVFNYSTSKDLADCKPVLYPHILSYGITDCEACCFTAGTSVFYSEDEDLVPGSILYSDLGDTPAVDGFYSDGTFFWTIDFGMGEIIISGDCDCDCTPLEPIGLSFESEFTGSAGTLDLYKSLNSTDWILVGTLSFPDSTPANTPVTGELLVEEGNYLKAVANYAGGAGGFQVIEYLLDSVPTQFRQDDLPFSDQTLITLDTTDNLYDRQFKVKVYQ